MSEFGRTKIHKERPSTLKVWTWRRWVAVVLACSTVALVPTVAPARTAAAATEIDWYVATPGYVRTSLQPLRVATGPAHDLLYVTVEVSFKQRLLAIDSDDFSVVAEVAAPAAGINEMVVSGNGEWLYAISATEVIRYDAFTLEELNRVTVGAMREGTLTAASDGRNRFAVLSEVPVIVTDGVAFRTYDTPLEYADMFGFAADSDELIAVTITELIRADINDGVGVITSTPHDYDPTHGIVQIEDDGESLVLWRSASAAVVDPVTLTVNSQQTFRGARFVGRAPVHQLSNGHVVTRSDDYNSLDRLYLHRIGIDDDWRGTPFSLPLQEGYSATPLAALPGGDIIALETGQYGSSYMVVLNVDVLTSGFGDYHAVTPQRLLDTRFAIGVPSAARVAPGETIEVDIAGSAGLPEEGVLAVTMNATVTESLGGGYIKIWPTAQPRPEVSNVNYTAGRTIANGVTVTVGPDGNVQIYNHIASAAHVLLDVTGYYTDGSAPPASRYVPMASPRRVLDSRNATQGPLGQIGPGEYLDLEVPYRSWEDIESVPGAVAAVLNVTVVDATKFSFVSVYPRDAPTRPNTSTINFYPGDIRSNLAIAPVPEDYHVRIYNHAGSVNVVVDLLGHYVTPSEYVDDLDQAGRYYPVVPFRRFDSRKASPFPGTGAIEEQSALLLSNSVGWTDIWNVTVTEPTSDGYVSVIPWFDGKVLETPPTSSVNFLRNETVANGAYATGGPDNAIVNPLGDTHVVVDVFGYLTPEKILTIDQAFGS